MKLTKEKKREILNTLVYEAYSIEAENRLLADLSDELKTLEMFEIPIMLYNKYPHYVRPEHMCYIYGDLPNNSYGKWFCLTFTYASYDYEAKQIQLNYLPSEVIEIVNEIISFEERRNIFRKNLEKIFSSCNTSKQLIDLIPTTSRFFNDLPKNTQVIPKELIDEINSVINNS